MVRRKRRRNRGAPGQRREPWTLETLKLPHALANERAIDTQERHDIRDGGQRNNIELTQKVDLTHAREREPALLAQVPLNGHEEDEHQPRGTDIGEAGAVVRSVRIDVSEDRRVLLHRVMVD